VLQRTPCAKLAFRFFRVIGEILTAQPLRCRVVAALRISRRSRTEVGAMKSCCPSDSVCRPHNLQKRRPPNCGASCVGKMPAAVRLFRTTASFEASLGLRLRDSRKAPTGGPVGKRSSGESEGYAGTGAALYSAPLTALPLRIAAPPLGTPSDLSRICVDCATSARAGRVVRSRSLRKRHHRAAAGLCGAG
jgi:hypothetical protein